MCDVAAEAITSPPSRPGRPCDMTLESSCITREVRHFIVPGRLTVTKEEVLTLRSHSLPVLFHKDLELVFR